jgi:hypothetical protein
VVWLTGATTAYGHPAVDAYEAPYVTWASAGAAFIVERQCADGQAAVLSGEVVDDPATHVGAHPAGHDGQDVAERGFANVGWFPQPDAGEPVSSVDASHSRTPCRTAPAWTFTFAGIEYEASEGMTMRAGRPQVHDEHTPTEETVDQVEPFA